MQKQHTLRTGTFREPVIHYAYKDSWTPVLGETLLVLRETTNPKDENAVGVLIEETIVRHVPYDIAPSMSRFLKRDVNMAIAKVTGGKINRGAGYGLEIPVYIRLMDPEYINRIKEIIDSLKTNELESYIDRYIVPIYFGNDKSSNYH